jgi:putative transposase
MLLTEQIQLKHSKELSNLCHLSKNLYNLANWYYRQDFFNLSNFLSYYDLDFMLKHKNAYRKLPSQTSQQILKLLIRNWKSYFRANKDFKNNPNKYFRKPRIPNYKKKNGESTIIFTNQQCRIKNGYLYFPKKVNIESIKTRIKNKLKEVRIVPLGTKYKVEIVYEKKEKDLGLNKDNILSIDLGLNNLITAVNNIGLDPIIIKGNIIKSINQFYNKQLAYYRSIENKKNNFQDTKRIKKLYLKRNNKLNTLFHRISRNIVNYCVENDIGYLIIGYNKRWKQNCNIGKKNNQNFIFIPFYKLIQQIEYKSKLIGINVIKTREDYTSKCSFLDLEEISKHKIYKGRRISRGLFKSSDGRVINADVNAGYNIMRKAFPNSLDDGIEVLGLIPQVISNNIFDVVT